jgi:hypothetical protein
MPQPLIAALPQDLVMASGYVIRLTALSPTTGATITGVIVTDVTFQVRPVNIGPGGTTDGEAPLPLLVPTDDTADTGTTTTTGATTPAQTVAVSPLHTQAQAVTDTAQRTFALAVADRLEPVAAPSVQLPAGTTPFHALANAISDTAVHLWAAAVANILEPL